MAYLGNQPVVGDSANTFKLLDDISSFTLTFDGSSASVVSVANNTLTFANHRFVTGQRVTYGKGGGTVITGLTDATAYFIIKVDQSTIKLATNASNAASSTAIDLTGLGAGTSHTLKVAFDGVNTKFKATHTSGIKSKISRAAQISLSINGVIQQPQDTSSPTVGYGVEADSTIVFSTAPVATDKVFGSFIGEVAPSFDLTDNTVDNFTGDGSTTTFTLSRETPSSQDVLVTLDGVTQHPSDASTTRSYSVVNQGLSFTSAPANGVAIQARHIGFAGATTSEVTGFYGRTGNVALTSTDDISVQNISAGIITATTFGGTPTFSGSVSIGGTLTYEDVTNVDAVGLITARSGILVGSGITLSTVGNIFATGVTTSTTFSANQIGINATSPNTELEIQAATDPKIRLQSQETGNKRLELYVDGGEAVGTIAADQSASKLAFRTSGTERVRIDQNGLVGIGTHTPSQLVDVLKSGNDAIIKVRTAGAGAYFEADSAATEGYYGLKLSTNGTDRWFAGSYNTDNFQIKDGSGASGSEVLTIADSTGNIGINNTVPSEKLDVVGNVKVSSSVVVGAATSLSTYLGQGFIELTRSSGDAYIDFKNAYADDFDSRIISTPNQLQFFTGGAGASFCALQTSTAKVAIATDVSPSIAKLEVHSDKLGGSAANTQELLYLRSPDVSNTTSYRFTNYRKADGTSHTSSEGRLRRHVDVTNQGYFGLGDGYVSLGYGNNESMRTSNAGAILLGTTNWPTGSFGATSGRTIVGNEGLLTVYNETNGAFSGGTLKLACKEGGDATKVGFVNMVGGTVNTSDQSAFFKMELSNDAGSGVEFFRVQKGGNGGRFMINHTDISTYNANLSVRHNSSGPYPIGAIGQNTSQGLIGFFAGDGTIVGSVGKSGSNVTFNTSSDYRLKENAVSISDGITRLKSLKPYKFNFIDDSSTTLDGFFAHEVSSVVPEAVTGEKDGIITQEYIDEGKELQAHLGKPIIQTLDHSKLVPLLTAALQEAITKIETLEAEVAALKG